MRPFRLEFLLPKGFHNTFIMCGGFNCSKNALTALNILFLIVSFVLIGTAAYAKAAAKITSFEIAGGIIACGLFLFFISILGLVAASKHHQVLLFFYFVVLFLLFLIQFSVSIACLAMSKSDVSGMLHDGWKAGYTNTTPATPATPANKTREDVERIFGCCGWDEDELNDITVSSRCESIGACSKNASDTLPTCKPCGDQITEKVSSMLVATGGIGFFFSLMELLGVYLAVRFRNQKDPKANPSQFL